MVFLGFKITNQRGESKEEARINSELRREAFQVRRNEITEFYWTVWDDPSHEYHYIVKRPRWMKTLMMKHYPLKKFGHMRITSEDGNHTYGRIVPINSTEYLQSNGLLIEKTNKATKETEWVKQKNGPDINLLSKPVLICILLLIILQGLIGVIAEIVLAITGNEFDYHTMILSSMVSIPSILFCLWLSTDLFSKKKPELRIEDR